MFYIAKLNNYYFDKKVVEVILYFAYIKEKLAWHDCVNKKSVTMLLNITTRH